MVAFTVTIFHQCLHAVSINDNKKNLIVHTTKVLNIGLLNAVGTAKLDLEIFYLLVRHMHGKNVDFDNP